MSDRLAHRCHVGVGAVELVDDRTQGERHVGAGVAVRDGVHVEVVHRLAVVDERVTKDGDDLAECSGIEDVQRHGFGSYKADVTGGDLDRGTLRRMQGVIKSYDPGTGDGVLIDETDLREIDLAENALEGSLFRMLRQGQRVNFELDDAGRATSLMLGSEADMETPDLSEYDL